jgi:hypothetical protein
VQLQEKYPQQLHAIALNVDFDASGSPPPELVSQVTSAQRQIGVTCESVLCSDPMEDVLSDFEIFGLPAALVFDVQGNLIRRFDGNANYESNVVPFVDDLLSE